MKEQNLQSHCQHRHGGEIKVNTKENNGTEFIIELPNQS